jgi:hypothetical protein
MHLRGSFDSQKTAIISLNKVNFLVMQKERERMYCEIGTECFSVV